MSIKLLPVIHYASPEQVLRNAARAFDAGCDGVFVIHMDLANHLLAPVARDIKDRWPDRLVGVNYLGRRAVQAVADNISLGLDMTWTDVQLTHSQSAPWAEAERAQAVLQSNPGHQLFVGVSFKHQRPEPDPGRAAILAHQMGFIPTTSGAATGVAAPVDAVATLRAALGEGPLAIASGITPDNASAFAPHLSHILVATGVSSSFHEFDIEQLRRLRAGC